MTHSDDHKKASKKKIRASTPDIEALMQAAVDGTLDFIVDFHERQQKQLRRQERNERTVKIQDARCDSGCSLLHWAAGHNQLHVVRYAINELKMDVNQQASHRLTLGRTAMHYACRNGCLDTIRALCTEFNADPDSRARHNISPFQLAVWQNQLETCQYLVNVCKVDPLQVNDFGCSAVHWIGMCPHIYLEDGDDNTVGDSNGSTNKSLLPMAQWLSSFEGIDFRTTQDQGHNALHKAAWGKHFELIKYLRDIHDMWDDKPDQSGNYAADIASMAGSPELANFIRTECSRERQRSCQVLGLAQNATQSQIRKAYLKLMKTLHPDKQDRRQGRCPSMQTDEREDGACILIDCARHDGEPTKCCDIVPHNNNHVENKNSTRYTYDEIVNAYKHLTKYRGHGTQRNPNHSLKLMLEWRNVNNNSNESVEVQNASQVKDHMPGKNSRESTQNEENQSGDETSQQRRRIFQARLRSVLLEFGDYGCPLDNIQKKWNQVWGRQNIPFPYQKGKTKCKLSRFLVRESDGMIKLVGKEPVMVKFRESRKRSRDER